MDRRSLSNVSKEALGALEALAAEVDGLVYVWRGNLLEADVTKLPRGVPDATPTYPVDTVLDYKVGFESPRPRRNPLHEPRRGRGAAATR